MGTHAVRVRHRHHAHFSAIQGARLKVMGHVAAGPERLRHHYNNTCDVTLLIPAPLPS